MKLFKASFLLIVLGLPLLGSNCGGMVKCPELNNQAACVGAQKADKSQQCRWDVTDVVVTAASCTGTPTSAPTACPALTGIVSRDMGNCGAVAGCTYTPPVSKSVGTGCFDSK